MERMNCDADGVIGELIKAPAFGRHYAGALDWMRRPYVVETTYWQERHYTAMRRGSYLPLRTWERSFVERFRKLGVPVHCDRFVVPKKLLQGASEAEQVMLEPYCLGYACDMFHSTLLDMPSICWEIFQHVGEELAEQQGLDLVWGGDERPWAWTVAQWYEYRWNPPARQDFDPDVVELRSPPGF